MDTTNSIREAIGAAEQKQPLQGVEGQSVKMLSPGQTAHDSR